MLNVSFVVLENVPLGTFRFWLEIGSGFLHTNGEPKDGSQRYLKRTRVQTFFITEFL